LEDFFIETTEKWTYLFVDKYKYITSLVEIIKHDGYFLQISTEKPPDFSLSSDLVNVLDNKQIENVFQKRNYKEHRSACKTKTDFDTISIYRRNLMSKIKNLQTEENSNHLKDKLYQELLYFYIDLILIANHFNNKHPNNETISTYNMKKYTHLKELVKQHFQKSFEEVLNKRVKKGNDNNIRRSLLLHSANSGNLNANIKLTNLKENENNRQRKCRTKHNDKHPSS
jgi:hypothetical protein